MGIVGLDRHAWLTVALVLAMLGTLIKSKLPADIVLNFQYLFNVIHLNKIDN